MLKKYGGKDQNQKFKSIAVIIRRSPEGASFAHATQVFPAYRQKSTKA